MDFGEIFELIIGFVILGFILFFILVAPIQFLNEPKRRPRRRSSRRPYKLKSAYVSYKPKDFDYYHIYNKTRFFVYFIENLDLNALKIGVGTGGRLLQLLNSHQDKSENSQNIGWKLLRLAVFADFETEYELGKIYAEHAEKKAHYYWRNILRLPIYLTAQQMGYSKVKNYGNVNWTLTKGYTETVERGKVCEVSTWNYVIKSSGFIEEQNDFMGYQPRELKQLNEEHSRLEEPLEFENFKLKRVRHYYEQELTTKEKKSVEERFWAKVDRANSDCWEWKGTKTNQKYGIFQFLDQLSAAHRIAWILEGREEIENSLLDNVCGNKSCVKPDHWKKSARRKVANDEKRISSFKCSNDGCNRPSRAIMKASLCESCRQKEKRIRGESRSNLSDEDILIFKKRLIGRISVYKCISQDCVWPSSSMLESTYCEICKRKMSKR